MDKSPMSPRPLLSNPYIDMMPIHEAAKFFGREYLLRRFYSAIANRQSISLIGSRHIGKSSLLTCACREEIQERFEVDLRRAFVTSDIRRNRDPHGNSCSGRRLLCKG